MKRKHWKTALFGAAALVLWQLPPAFCVYRVLLLAMGLAWWILSQCQKL